MTGDGGSNRLADRVGILLARRVQLLRYAGVSVIATLTSLTVLGVLVGAVGVGAVVANLAATAIGTVPSYELNRRWVWRAGTKRSIGREVVPFCALSFAGLLMSTVTVHVASSLSSHGGRLIHTGAVEFANVAAYGSLWVVQFLLLDRVLFARRTGSRLPAGEKDLFQDAITSSTRGREVVADGPARRSIGASAPRRRATLSPNRSRQSPMPLGWLPPPGDLPGWRHLPWPAGRAPGPGAGPLCPGPAGSMSGPHSPPSSPRPRRA